MDTIQVFHAALEQARDLTKDRDELQSRLEDSRATTSTMLGENHQLRVELEAVRMALAQAQGVASGRMAMIYELSAQLSTLGLFATTIAGEVRRILDKVNEIVPAKQAVNDPPPTPDTKVDITEIHDETQVEVVGPYVGNGGDVLAEEIADRLEARLSQAEGEGKANIPFAQHATASGRRTHLLSETATRSPAFLHRGGSPDGGGGYQQLTGEQISSMNWKEKKLWRDRKIIPERFRR